MIQAAKPAGTKLWNHKNRPAAIRSGDTQALRRGIGEMSPRAGCQWLLSGRIGQRTQSRGRIGRGRIKHSGRVGQAVIKQLAEF
jgi:hypothetical protein